MINGNMHITRDLNIIYNAPIQTTRIVDMDEDGALDDNNIAIVPGTILLPPVEAKIAEADGNEQAYDGFYYDHLTSEPVQMYISALLAYLSKGGNLLCYLPNDDDNTRSKFIFHFFNIYGIRIGDLDSKDPNLVSCFCDSRYSPIWLRMLYLSNFISPYEYMYKIPVNIEIDKVIMDKLIYDIKPYGETYMEMYKWVNEFKTKIKMNPKLRPAVILSR